MALKFRDRKNDAKLQAEVRSICNKLNQIYSNKSGDEYKMSGDITKSPVYDKIQRMVADLSTLRGMNKTETDEIKKMFNLMHRPVFKTTVTKYITKRDDEDIVPVILYTIGYRVLVGELGRIYTSTEATEKGIIYKPDKISKKNSLDRFIRVFNSKLDTELNKFVRKNTKPVIQQEAFVGSAAAVTGAIAVLMDRITPFFEEIGAWFELLHIGELINPVAFINRCLSGHYDKKVEKFNQAADLYEATKEAYDEYMKLPASQRKQKVESRYMKNINKYNIKMQNAAAKIAHYDQRSIKEARTAELEDAKKWREGSSSSSTKSEPKEPSSSSGGSSSGSGDFDF